MPRAAREFKERDDFVGSNVGVTEGDGRLHTSRLSMEKSLKRLSDGSRTRARGEERHEIELDQAT